MVGGPTRDVTLLMQAVPGLLCKDGAEGVQAWRCPDGRAVAVKVADGGGRARTPVTVAALQSLGVELDPAAFTEAVLGHGDPVGAVVSLVGSVSGGPEFRPLDGVVYGRVEQVAPGLRRVVAAKPSKFPTATPARTSWAPVRSRSRPRPGSRHHRETPSARGRSPTRR